MTALVAITQRVDIVPGRNERRDSLDQRWYPFLAACGVTGVPLPNHPATALALVAALAPGALVLSGGNDLAALGGDSPERDATEDALLAWARGRAVPVLGVCRGLQFLAHRFGAELVRVDDHVGTPHPVAGPGARRTVNSFHTWAVRTAPPGFASLAQAEDGTIEMMRHRQEPITAVMWHPEREAAAAAEDVALVRQVMGRDA